MNAETLTSSDALLRVVEQLLERGCRVRFRASGRSMHPTIRDGEALTLAPIRPCELRTGDIVLSRQAGRPVAHRVVKLTRPHARPRVVVLRGDAQVSCDAPVTAAGIVARVVAVERNGRTVNLASRRARAVYFARAYASSAKHSAAAIVRYLSGHTAVYDDSK